jgi:hypothetical protein
MAAARSRRTREGRLLGGSERLGARAALALVTSGAAAALGRRDLGRLVPGAAADAILVDEDPLRVDPETAAAIRPILTIVEGDVTWKR